MREETTTQSCLCFVLICAQCFGLLPVTGISSTCNFLQFKWTSKRTLASLCFLIAAAINALAFAGKMITEDEMTFGDWCSFQFYAVSVAIIVLFLHVARKWPKLMKKWTEVDVAMSTYGFPRTLQRKLKLFMIVFLAAAIAEHALFVSAGFEFHESGNNFNKNVHDYFRYRYEYAFVFVSYHLELGIVLEVLDLFNSISWNFMDVFIIVISMCLAERFSQVATNVDRLLVKKISNENSWRTVREDYGRLIDLCKLLDEVMSGIITLSFGNNIFMVLVQLYTTLRINVQSGTVQKVYSVCSFILLIVRLIAVALYAADINHESKKPRHYLNKSPHSVHNIEIERLLQQAMYSTAALTGFRMFRVTKTLILRICVALVSYELVLAQYLTISVKGNRGINNSTSLDNTYRRFWVQ